MIRPLSAATEGILTGSGQSPLAVAASGYLGIPVPEPERPVRRYPLVVPARPSRPAVAARGRAVLDPVTARGAARLVLRAAGAASIPPVTAAAPARPVLRAAGSADLAPAVASGAARLRLLAAGYSAVGTVRASAGAEASAFSDLELAAVALLLGG